MTETRIPKILSQVWVGPKPKPARLMSTWATMNPSWTYRVIGNDDVDLERMTPGVRRAYEAISEWNGKADILRYLALWAYGGFIVDADSEALRPLPDEWFNCDAVACWEHETHLPGTIATGYIGSVPEGALVGHVLREIDRRSGDHAWLKLPAWRSVGPTLFTEVAAQHPELRILPAKHLIPEHYCGKPPAETGEPPVARQYWGSTVHSPHYGYRGLT